MFCGIIYKAVSPSSKSYLGKTTKSLNKRIKDHYQKSKHKNFHFSNAIRKYGIENFSWQIIEIVERESLEELHKSLNERERFWIQKEKTHLREYGYNMTEGGDGFMGISLSEEHRMNIGKAGKGRIFSSEHKENLRKDWEKTHFNTGKKSEESKDKLRQKSLSVQKVICEHCHKEFTPWGFSHHLKKLNKE